MGIDQAVNFRAISESTSTAGELSREQLAELGTCGYQVVINLLPPENDHALQDEQAIVEAQGLVYYCIPVNFAAPRQSDYYAFVQVMNACEGKKLMIHCAANYRVSVFYAIYAYEHLGWTAERAGQHIRSVWQPKENPPWSIFLSGYLPDC